MGWQHAVPAARRKNRALALRHAAKEVGLELTAQHVEFYRRAYRLGYAAGHLAGTKLGHVQGWTEASKTRSTA